MRVAAIAAVCVLSACGVSASAFAAEIDCQTVRLVVPYPPGGAADVGARLLGEQLSAKIGKTVVVENRPGASGNIGTQFVVGSPKDGCTLLINANSISTYTASFNNLSYDPMNDLIVVSAIGKTPTVLVTANKDIGDLKDLQDWAKKNPNGLNYGSTGYGTFAHLAVEEIAARTGARLQHVPYRGGGQATTDMVSGRLDFGSFAVGTVLPFIKQQQVKPLAVVQPGPSALVPEAKPTSQQGLGNLDATLTFMFFAPSGTPAAVVSTLNAALNEAASKPEISARLQQLGYEASLISPADGMTLMRDTAKDWVPVVRRLGIKIE